MVPDRQFLTFWLGNVLRATTACTSSTSIPWKVAQAPHASNILTWKGALRHNDVQFLGIWTSKSGPKLRCFGSPHNGVQFFHILTSKSGPRPSFFNILTWKCASRHNSMQLFISYLATWPHTGHFRGPTFRPSRATNHWKNTVVRLASRLS